ncbi:hypothetical protein GCM10010365_45080 [Streptomyces poonensis]|uniref:Uncharacterized protein n=1 Tax=Streptomyces poonensis TaxID=68255 RepID=A0A918PRV8_9ACTN|nr:hypothetical protein GCM10010365_45080 [Streptomyces poonensis]
MTIKSAGSSPGDGTRMPGLRRTGSFRVTPFMASSTSDATVARARAVRPGGGSGRGLPLEQGQQCGARQGAGRVPTLVSLQTCGRAAPEPEPDDTSSAPVRPLGGRSDVGGAADEG